EAVLPDRVTFAYGGRLIHLPVQKRSFEIPSDIATQEAVAFMTVIDGDRISVHGVSGKKFVHADLTILIADRRYDQSLQWAVPKNANIRSSCVVQFQPQTGEDGTFVFVQNCRSSQN
ncbi:MAG TPA: hypothetical protein VGJ21_19735, partial [Terracidiphilus sp.]